MSECTHEGVDEAVSDGNEPLAYCQDCGATRGVEPANIGKGWMTSAWRTPPHFKKEIKRLTREREGWMTSAWRTPPHFTKEVKRLTDALRSIERLSMVEAHEEGCDVMERLDKIRRTANTAVNTVASE